VTFKHCPECGNKNLTKDIGDDKNIPYCETCKRPWFPFSYTCIITLVVDENENFALIKQNIYNLPPDIYILVAGFINPGETFEEAVKREVFEEIGLVADGVNYVNSYYFSKRDQIMAGFVTKVKHGEFKLSEEVDDAKWFSKDDVASAISKDSIVAQLFNDYKFSWVRNAPN